MRRALALATCVQVSASSTRDIAERQAAALGLGAMGSPRPSACSEKGVHTAPAKSPPRVARPTTACCAPFMPPGSGAMRATAATMRTISQAPNPQRPVRAVSTVPATVCQSSRKPASTRMPPLKTKSMSPMTAWRATSTSLRKESRSRVALSAVANISGSMVWASAAPETRPEAPRDTKARPAAERAAPRTVRRRRSRSSSRRQRQPPPDAGKRPGPGELPATGELPSKSVRTLCPRRRAACPTSPRQRPISGAKRKRRRRMLIGAQLPDRSGPAGGASLPSREPAAPPPWRPGARPA